MHKGFYINSAISMPVYKQVISQIEQKIISGEYAPGDLLPSMNELSAQLEISKETIKKGYAILRDKGVIESRQGKGFYVCGIETKRPLRILLLFDKLSSYKQVLFQSFMDRMGGDAEVTIRIHNQNLDVFEFFIDEDVDNFDYYVVAPHFSLSASSQKRMLKLLKRFPNRKLILVDHMVDELQGNYGAVYQDFTVDIAFALAEGLDKLKEFSKLNVLIMPNSLYAAQIRQSIEGFCTEHSLSVEFHFGVTEEIIRPNEVYLMLNSQHDDGLISLSRAAAAKGLKIGEDISVISYNDAPINEVILNGLTSVSTDFKQMGEIAAQMILNKTPFKTKCDFRLIRRSTF
jgi:DNA-binding transcriptional regulator YhcF (GntR family)